MATTINASTSGLIETSDGTAVLDLQTGGTTAIRVNATQAIGVGSTPSFGSAGQFLTSQGSAASPTWTSGGTGTVTSVGWTGGIVTVATATTTPAFTIAGTSGGNVYFKRASTWASSAALTQYGAVFGGGAGGAPASTAAGTTGQFLGANTGGAPTWQTPAGGSPGGSNGQFQYNNSSAFGGAAVLLYNATGPIVLTTIGVGNTTPSASGSGVSFPATQSASSDANTLDDYEEGSWTPTLKEEAGSAAFTYTYQLARYVKVGAMVSVYGYIQIASLSGASSGSLKLTSFPFTNSGSNVSETNALKVGQVSGTWTTLAPTGGYLRDNQNEAYLTSITGTTQTIIPANYATANSGFNFAFTYTTGL
jgi:hypothetical protein